MGNPQRKRLIHVDRPFLRRCAEVLAPEPKYAQWPLRSIITLIYGLNGLAANLSLRRFDDGLPRTSVIKRQLTGVKTLANRAARTGKTGPLQERVSQLYKANIDSVYLLHAMLRDHPAYQDEHRFAESPKAQEILAKACAEAPSLVETLAMDALDLRSAYRRPGRGGERARPDPIDVALIDEAGRLFARLTGYRMLEEAQTVPLITVVRFHDFVELLFAHFRPGHTRRAILDQIARLYPDRAKPEDPEPPMYRKRSRAGKYS